MNYGAESFSDELSDVDLNALSLGGGAKKTGKKKARKSKSRSRSRGRSTGSQSGGKVKRSSSKTGKKKARKSRSRSRSKSRKSSKSRSRSRSKGRKAGKQKGGAKSKSRSRSRSKASKSRSRSRSHSRSSRGSSQSGGRKGKKASGEDKIYSMVGQNLVINTKTATDAAKKFASKMLRKKGAREGKVTVRFRCLSPGKTQNYEYVYDLEKKKVKATSKIGKKSIAGKDGMVSKFTKVVKVDKIRPNSK
jgi:hypothetical protein